MSVDSASLAFACGALVGISLGLTGGGGSIFAVPLLIYVLGLDLPRAVALSLAVVGSTALYGAVLQARRGQVLWGAGLLLGAGGIVAAPLGAALGRQMPAQVSLLLFSVLMVFIGLRMLRRPEAPGEIPHGWATCELGPDGRPKFTLPCAAKLLLAGALAGVLSGIFGVGGGFLVVPALLLVTGASMAQALATSLVGIFLIATAGFAVQAQALGPGEMTVGQWFLGGALAGMTGGIALKSHLPGRALQKIFGGSMLAVAAYVALRTLWR